MANLPETPVFTANIYQIETTDKVLGGPDGVVNLQSKQIADRTAWLKQEVEAAAAIAVSGESKADSALAQVAAAETAMGSAAASAASALLYKNDALAAKALAEQARSDAQAAAADAAAAATGAAADRVTAGQRAAEAQASATSAVNAASFVQADRVAAQTARNEAVGAQSEAEAAAVAADADRVAAEAAAAAADSDRIAAEAARTGAEAAQAAVYGDLASSAAGKGAELIAYSPAGTGSAATTVHSKLREVVSVKDFGAVGDGSDETTRIQNALNYAKQTGATLEFEPGKTYLVSGVSFSQAGGNTRSNFRIEGNGALLQGTTSAATLTLYRAQGMNIRGLRVEKHASATYASILDSFWFANFTECSFGETKLHADVNWGMYWNEFNGCSHASLHFDLADYTINHNVWKGGQVGPITKTNAGHATFKEAYNNVFIGVDMLGAIDWRDASSAFHDPLVLRDCNMEYTGVNYGYIIAEGGRSNPVNAASTRFFPEDDLRSEFNQQYSGSSWVTGWYPWSSTNLFRGGACQAFSPDIGEVAVAGSLSLYADATSPTGNGYCYRLYNAGTTSARIRLRMPVEFLDQAKKVGYVTFSLWVYNVNGGAFVANTSGSVPSGDSYFTGYSLPANQWVQRFVTIPVSSSATDVALYVGGGTVTGFDVRVANICCTLGKVARPYTPAPGEPHPKRALSFQKTLVANGTAQNTFSLTIPASNTSGSVRIKAVCNMSDSVSIYTGLLHYARHNTGSQIAANIVEQGKAQSTYAAGTAGTIGAMAASATGGTVTVTTTIVSYSGSPNRGVTYEVEFLDANETLTVL